MSFSTSFNSDLSFKLRSKLGTVHKVQELDRASKIKLQHLNLTIYEPNTSLPPYPPTADVRGDGPRQAEPAGGSAAGEGGGPGVRHPRLAAPRRRRRLRHRRLLHREVRQQEADLDEGGAVVAAEGVLWENFF